MDLPQSLLYQFAKRIHCQVCPQGPVVIAGMGILYDGVLLENGIKYSKGQILGR